MKRLLSIAIVSQLGWLGCTVGIQAQEPKDEAAYQTVVARVRAEQDYLTQLLGLEERFSADDERNVKNLYHRFPKGTSTKAIEADLRASVAQEENVRIKFSRNADSLRLAVRFLTEKPSRRETRYTFTFKQDVQGKLSEAYYLTEHFSGGWSGPKDDNGATSKSQSNASNARPESK